MPAYNTASMIGAAIGSVLAQTRGDFELLVVDDGSTDGTREVVRRYAADPRVRLLAAGPRQGPGAARNAAIACARGRYVSMLDSDDLWLPDYLAAAGDALERHPSAGLACADHWTLEDPPGLLRRQPLRRRRQPLVLDADAFLLRLAQRNFVVNSTVTLRRSLLEEVGGCNSALPAAVDLDLWLRAAAAGYGAVCLPQSLAVYRVRRGSIQHEPGNEFRAHVALRDVYRAVAEEWEVADETRAAARAQVESIDRRIATLTGERRVRASLLAARRRAGLVKRIVLRRQIWYSVPPPEVGGAPRPRGDRPLAPGVARTHACRQTLAMIFEFGAHEELQLLALLVVGGGAADPGRAAADPVPDPARPRRPPARLRAGRAAVTMPPEVVLIGILPPLLYVVGVLHRPARAAAEPAADLAARDRARRDDDGRRRRRRARDHRPSVGRVRSCSARSSRRPTRSPRPRSAGGSGCRGG